MKYHIFSQTLFDEYIGEYHNYGIASNCGKAVVQDVSINKSVAENIVHMLNKYDVALVHVYDVIEDMLAG